MVAFYLVALGLPRLLCYNRKVDPTNHLRRNIIICPSLMTHKRLLSFSILKASPTLSLK